jgi:hypothetical protein
MITLRFVSHRSLLGPLFRLAQAGAKWTHVEAVTVTGYLGAMLSGGVQERPWNYDAGAFDHERFVHLDATPKQDNAFFAFLSDKIGQPYDPIAVLYFFGFFASRRWEDPGSWECTELIAAALIACGWMPDNAEVPACRLTPANLYWMTSTVAAMTSGRANA